MTVRQMRAMLKGLPGSMSVMMLYGESRFKPVCGGDSQIVEMQKGQVDPNTMFIKDDDAQPIPVLMLMPCLCCMEEEDAMEDLIIDSINNANINQ